MRSYENKVMGNFTMRQIICLIVALAFIAPTFWILFSLTNSVDIAGYMAAVIGIPIVACGFIKKDGVYLEKMIVAKWQSKKKYNQHRHYEMHNFYEDIEIIYKESLLNDEIANAEKEKQEETNKKSRKNKSIAMDKKKHRTK